MQTEKQPLLVASKANQDAFCTRSSQALPPPPLMGGGGMSNSKAQGQDREMTPTRNHDQHVSSLDFERVVNDCSIEAMKNRKRSMFGYTGRTAIRWALTILVGVLTGLTAISIVQITERLISWRQSIFTDKLFLESNSILSSLPIFGLFAIINLILCSASCLLCIAWVPEGAGSGIPEVKAYLNGVRVKRFSSVPLFVVKILGTILSVSSGLAIGMEGPLVHIGAIVGASCTKLPSLIARTAAKLGFRCGCFKWLWSWTKENLSHFCLAAERRDFVSIGASVGFAASFGAPIGGLLFVLDDISSYFGKALFLRTLVANAIGTFILACSNNNLSNYSIINLGNSLGEPNDLIFLNRFEELPLYVLVGIMGGIMGGLFCQIYEFFQRHYQHRYHLLLQVMILSIITSTLLFYLPMMAWTCKDVTTNDADMAISNSTSHLHYSLFCFGSDRAQVNELATMFFGSRDEAIKRILSDPSQFEPATLWTVGFVFYGLMTLTFGRSLPSGIFMPSVLIGASLGGGFGLWLKDVFSPEITPSTFALLGVAALLAGIQRSTVSLCVILVEGTGQIKVLIPVIISVVVARYIATTFFTRKGIYGIAMESKNYPHLDHAEPKHYDVAPVSSIMSTPVVTVGSDESAQHLVKLLLENDHHGFPVVEPSTQKLLGLIRRDQIVALLECGVFIPSTNNMNPKDNAFNHDIEMESTDNKFESMINNYNNSDAGILEQNNDFDTHDWLLSIHENLRPRPNSVDESIASYDLLPPLVTRSPASSTRRTSSSFIKIGLNTRGTRSAVRISWLHPDFHNKRVNLAAAMNRGTYCVLESCPISKAHSLFTSLGLRHLIVLGGGQNVVGLLTRANLVPSSIDQSLGRKNYNEITK
mmetsp:Transcript_25938/g.39172  ORF Transcript_25938/g.39172 Transcript_25938/m.39172 type:complete len:874 (+) Transcript_25938:66-2687(+)